MRNSTITDYFSEQLELLNINVTDAIYTTYALDISFFECEIIPLLFTDDETFSYDARIKELQVREKLEESGIAVNLFYDSNCDEIVEQSGVRSFPSMEYGFFGISVGGAVFHPKIVMVLGNERVDTEPPVKKMFLFVGSNNLTKAGWWENIEVCTSLSFTQGDSVHPTSINNLNATIDYLVENSSVNVINPKALASFREFIDSLIVVDKSIDRGVYFFQPAKGKDFPSFLAQHIGSDFKTECIISPFFPEDDQTDIVDAIKAETGFQIYLPRSGTKALLTEGLFNHIKDKNGFWSDFKPEINKELVPNDSVSRKVHAKLYGFSGGYYFIGSVNFTRKAFFENVEAGLLFKPENNSLKLLLPYKIDKLTFSEPDELHKKFSEKSGEKASLNIFLHFDWNEKQLSVNRNSTSELISISIQNNSGKQLVNFEMYSGTESCSVVENHDELIKHLEKNSFVLVLVGEVKENLYVHQSNWTHKPQDYPYLTPDEIIRIYVELNKKRDLTSRGSILIEAMYRLFQQSEFGYGSEYTIAEAVKNDRSFFSEYAEIFYGFRKLNQLLREKPEKQPYFLTSECPDALPAFIKSVINPENSALDNVSRYLVLLSIDEIYHKYQKEGLRFEELREHLNKNISLLEKFLIEEVSDENFLGWFKEQFFKPYKKAGDNE